MAQRGGGDISQRERTVMVTIMIPALHKQMDVIAALQLRMDELWRIAAQWAQDTDKERFLADRAHLLVRGCSGRVMGKETLGEMGVENNECFYLF